MSKRSSFWRTAVSVFAHRKRKNTSRYQNGMGTFIVKGIEGRHMMDAWPGMGKETNMELHITCIPGDGIGPEIIAEAKKVLEKVAACYGHQMVFTDILMGGASIDAYGVPLTEESIQTARAADAVLMGSIGGDTTRSPWYKLPPNLRPEAGLLAIRKALNLFANLRPAVLYEELAAACPLKEEISRAGFDMLIMRELTGGLYFGERKTVEEIGRAHV